MLTQSEIDAIKQEAEEYAALMLWTNPEELDQHLFHEYISKRSFTEGAVIERQRAKVLCEKIDAFMATIPLDNRNWYLSNFDVALAELKETLNTYNKNKPT